MRNISENPRSQLRWIIDVDQKRLDQIAKVYPQARLTTNLAEALADPELKALAVATPVATHFPLARQCLEAGKDVLLEKPMAQTVADCQELNALAAQKGAIIMVDHTFIYSSPVRAIKSIIESGELGEIYYFDSVRVNLGLFQHDVNVVWDLAPHDLSIMDYVMQDKPLQISAVGSCHVAGKKQENIAYLTLRYANETLAHFHVNWLAPAKVRRILIGGSKKMLVFDDLSPDEKIRIYDKGLMPHDESDPESSRMQTRYRIGDLYVPYVDRTEPLKRCIDHFLDCVANRQKPLTDGEAGLRIVNILEAAQKSMAQNGAFISL
jgi:predicted dehydrogenase